MHLFVPFVSFESFETCFVSKHKKAERVSYFLIDDFPKDQTYNFKPKNLFLPCPSHLNLHIDPNTWIIPAASSITPLYLCHDTLASCDVKAQMVEGRTVEPEDPGSNLAVVKFFAPC